MMGIKDEEGIDDDQTQLHAHYIYRRPTSWLEVQQGDSRGECGVHSKVTGVKGYPATPGSRGA